MPYTEKKKEGKKNKNIQKRKENFQNKIVNMWKIASRKKDQKRFMPQ